MPRRMRMTGPRCPPEQESLANAARHGAGRATVQLTYDEAELGLIVTNPVTMRTNRRSGGGHGIVGMHERAALLGGTLDTSRVNGEFRVHARLPYGAART
jgi:signal transduction histidine kinase